MRRTWFDPRVGQTDAIDYRCILALRALAQIAAIGSLTRHIHKILKQLKFDCDI